MPTAAELRIAAPIDRVEAALLEPGGLGGRIDECRMESSGAADGRRLLALIAAGDQADLTLAPDGPNTLAICVEPARNGGRIAGLLRAAASAADRPFARGGPESARGGVHSLPAAAAVMAGLIAAAVLLVGFAH